MRLFVGVVPPDRVLDEIAALRRPERPGVRWTRRDQWHVTLRFLGALDDPGPVAAALDAAGLRRCEARVGPTVGALGRHVVCLPVTGLDELAGAVAAATAGFGRPPDGRGFRGHLTLARLRRPARPSELTGGALAAGFPVTDVRLIRSHQAGGGSRYEDVHVVSLGA